MMLDQSPQFLVIRTQRRERKKKTPRKKKPPQRVSSQDLSLPTFVHLCGIVFLLLPSVGNGGCGLTRHVPRKKKWDERHAPEPRVGGRRAISGDVMDGWMDGWMDG
jgi:hypothetical protein